jgi:4,5-DOPA dioxygenase extradiol
MPVLFVGHGNPMNAIETNEFTEGFRDLAKTLPKPAAVLCVSAHWETDGTQVTAMEKPQTIHDFYGFPPELYKVQYPAVGCPSLANEIKALLGSAVSLDNRWGLDHGCWSFLRHIYPEADVPVVQLSLDSNKTAKEHYDLAKRLKPLRERGVLIVGSGNMVHNLTLAAWDQMNTAGYGFDWALDASAQMKKFILSDNHKALINYRAHGNAYNLVIPTAEHYLPLLYALALKGADEKIALFNDKAVAGSLTMTSLKIGE